MELTPELAAECRLELAKKISPFAGLPSEHIEQVTLIRWANSAVEEYPDLRFLVAVPNFSGHYGPVLSQVNHGKRLNAEGRRRGYPDLLLDAGHGGWLGWRGEVKKRSVLARVTKEQREWHDRLREQGYRVDVCYGYEHAKQLLVEYMALPITPHRTVSDAA